MATRRKAKRKALPIDLAKEHAIRAVMEEDGVGYMPPSKKGLERSVKRQMAKNPVPVIRGPHPKLDWISVKTARPNFDQPVLVTDGVEFAHCSRLLSDRAGDHYMLVDEGSEFTKVTHWCEEPLLPNGKPPKVCK